jgi:hypothetical protein
MTSAPARAIDLVIAEAAKPILKAAGYKRSARHFHREADGLVRVVHFQASAWNDATSARFTINLHVTCSGFHEAFTGEPFPKNPGSAAAFAEERIGRVMPENRDVWWTVEPNADTKAVSAEVEKALREYGLPFLARFESKAQLLAAYDAGKSLPGYGAQHLFCHAVLLTEAGRAAEAEDALRRELEGATTEWYDDGIREFAGRLGLDLART